MPVKTVPNLDRKFRKGEATCKGIILMLQNGEFYTWIIRRVCGRWATGKAEFPGGTTESGDFPVEALARELREEARVVGFDLKALPYHNRVRSQKSGLYYHHKLFFVVINPTFDPNLDMKDMKMSEPERVRLTDLDPDRMAEYHGNALLFLQKGLGIT